MSATTEGQRRSSESPAEDEKDPRVAAAKAVAGGDRGREMVAHAAQGAKLSEEEESDALDYLLGAPEPVIHRISVDYETTAGMRKLEFVIRSVDTRKIDEIETRNMQNNGMIDRITADCEIVALATVYLGSGGRKVELTSDEFLTVQRRDESGELVPLKLAAPPVALERRFKDQMGLINGVALSIKRAAGYGPDRVGQPKRISAADAMLRSASLG